MSRENGAHLLHLVRRRLASRPLHVDQLLDPRPEEHAVTAAHPLFESEMEEQAAEIVETDVRTAPAAEDLEQDLLMLARRANLPDRAAPGQSRAAAPPPPLIDWLADLPRFQPQQVGNSVSLIGNLKNLALVSSLIEQCLAAQRFDRTLPSSPRSGTSWFNELLAVGLDSEAADKGKLQDGPGLVLRRFHQKRSSIVVKAGQVKAGSWSRVA
jgi:hypothetical protein